VSTGVETGLQSTMPYDVESKLMLSEEATGRLMLYGDSQKMMEGAEILHDEFPLDGRYGLL
jgi:hypothetical protein